MDSRTNITIPLYGSPFVTGPRYFKQTETSNDELSREPDLLRTIRAAFKSSGSEPSPPFHTVISPVISAATVSDDPFSGEEELSWNSDTVVWSVGGIVKQKWCFKEENQRIQYACFGWMLQPGMVNSGQTSSPAHFTSSENPEPAPFSFTSKLFEGKDKDPFSPFFRAQKARQRVVEAPSFARGIYVFLRSIGKVVLFNGLEFTFSLPFIVRQAWALYPYGVLMQRVLDSSELEEDDDDDDFIFPTLFSLTNPFSEPQAVGLTENIIGGYGSTPPELSEYDRPGDKPLRYIPADEQVIFVSTRYLDACDDIVATIDSSRKKISFWRYVHIPPSNIPSAFSKPKRRRLSRRGTSVSLGMGDTVRQSNHVQELAARIDRIREPSPEEFEPTQPVEFMEMPPLSALPGMPPALESTNTLPSLAAGAPAPSWPPRGRKNSLNRNDLSSTMDRMVLGRRNDGDISTDIVTHERIQPSFWMERLYTYEDRKSTRLNSSHSGESRMPSSA